MRALALILSMAFVAPSFASEPLSLKRAEDLTLSHSSRLQASRADADAVAAQAYAMRSGLYPRLALEGSYRYTTEIPSLTIGPSTVSFGAHDTYSIGPVLSYSLWDGGSVRSNADSLDKLAQARALDLRQSELNVRQTSRLAYFRCQQSEQELKLITESLKLAESQERDVQNRFRAGASSKIDTLSAHREVLSLRIKRQQVEAELAANFRDLSTLMGFDDLREFQLEPQAQTLQSFAEVRVKSFNSEHPQLEAISRSSEAAELASQASRGELWPRLGIYAKSSLDYPNGPKIERIWQNTVGATLSFTLFEADRARNLAVQKARESEAASHRREQVREDLARDWQKAQIQLKALEEQRDLATAAAKEASEVSELIYASYKAGRLSFLDVQGANNRALEARVQLSRIETQILGQLAQLATLSR